MEVFAELLSTFGSFFQKEHLGMISALLTSSWGEEHLKEVVQEPDDEVPSFARLALAFGEITVKELVTDPNNPTNRAIMCKCEFVLIFQAVWNQVIALGWSCTMESFHNLSSIQLH
jgi:hypothetical protein